MDYTISYYSDKVEAEVLGLPDTLQARYASLTQRMLGAGANFWVVLTPKPWAGACSSCD